MDNIKKAIEDQGRKHVWVATKVGRTKQELSQWLSGTRTCPGEVKESIEKLLGIHRSQSECPNCENPNPHIPEKGTCWCVDCGHEWILED